MRQDVFTGRMFRRLFVPSLWASVGLAFSDMADALVVGWRLGETGLAAIGMTLPLFMVINLFMHGLGIGGSVRYAQLLGAGKREEAVDSFLRVLLLALALSCAIALSVNLFPGGTLCLLGAGPAGSELYRQTMDYVRLIGLGAPVFFLNYILNYYLRADGQQRRASAGFLAGTGTDIGLNLVLVLGLDMGTAGAALATLAGSAAAVAAYLPGLLDRRGTLTLRRVRPAWREAFSCLRTGLSSSVQYIYQLVFLLIATRTLLNCFGQTGVAVFDVAQNASYLILYLYDAAAKALQPLVSTFHGEKNRAAVARSLRLALGWGLAFGMLAAGLIGLFPQAVCAAFGLSGEEAAAVGGTALRLYCLSSVFAGVSVVLEAYFQSVEREREAFVLATLRGCAVLLPVTLLLAVVWPSGLWWVFPIGEGLSLGVFLLWYRARPAGEGTFPPERILYRQIRSRTEDLGGLSGEVDAFCARWGATPRQEYLAHLAIEEISVAIISKAFDRASDGYIQITLIACPDGGFQLHVRDNAAWFDPFSLETGKMGESGSFDMDAIGMLVVKKQAKDFFYRQYQGFNTLVVSI
ncbi:MAG TPA: polysaccharide biosynthesis C-terminal domain-containing protein [Candidatus Intestinimonas stercorigallinarum]|nr:polysaccharide biosynthesis C-terminal domain-containing protein [Candidatus Intestinimonas stercorigallinarum]